MCLEFPSLREILILYDTVLSEFKLKQTRRVFYDMYFEVANMRLGRDGSKRLE